MHAGKKRIFLSSPHMGGEELSFVKEAFDANWVAPLGPHVDAFERDCAEYAGARAALALSSGTAATTLAARLLGIRPGDMFFCSSLTFIASISPIVQMGGIPVFIDSEPQSWNMSPAALKRALDDAERAGKLPKVVILVNLYGQSCDMDSLLPLCRERGIPIIEDAAESLGGLYRGRPTGNFGTFGFYSFNGNKIITTAGGGMLLSDDEEAINRARFLSTQAREKTPWYEHIETGYNFRLSNVLAGIGRAQFKLLERRVAERRAVFDRYREALDGRDGITFMPEPQWSRSNRWLTTMQVDPEETRVTNMEIIEALAEENIESRPVWKPMHLQPVFENALYYPHEEERDVASELFSHGICLPSGSNLEAEDQERVLEAISAALKV